jgi:hexokinase
MTTEVRQPLIEISNYENIRDVFARELTLSSQGQKTSLPFIKNILPNHPLVLQNDIFQVFVFGGTSGEVALVQLDIQGFSIVRHQKIPLLPKFATANDFFAFIERNLDSQAKAIGINFAFTLIPTVGDKGELDGIMMSGDTKGHSFIGLQKEEVGKKIKEYFKSKSRDIIVTVANDTVCLIASGMKENVDRSTLAAGIVGTGYNMAFFLDEHTIINVQASDFTGFTPTISGRIVDEQSFNKGEQLYNKEVAAGELYKHFNALIAKFDFAIEPLQSTEELALLAQNEEGKNLQMAQELFHRSASLVAAQFAGLYEYKKKPKTLLVIMEGSLFWKGPDYKNTVEAQLEFLGVPAGVIRFEEIKNSGSIGAIKLLTGK